MELEENVHKLIATTSQDKKIKITFNNPKQHFASTYMIYLPSLCYLPLRMVLPGSSSSIILGCPNIALCSDLIDRNYFHILSTIS
jgi:nitrate reductase beta subunit